MIYGSQNKKSKVKNYYEGDWAYEKKHGLGTMHWKKSKEKVYCLT